MDEIITLTSVIEPADERYVATCRELDVATMPRRVITAASSVVDHWLIGGPEALGAPQASAMIRHTCSGLIPAGVPECGASANRAAMLNSAIGTAWTLRHCLSLTGARPARRSSAP